MNKSEIAHQYFIGIRKNPMAVKELTIISSVVRTDLSNLLKGNAVNNLNQQAYLKWILAMSEKKYYLSSLTQGEFFLINRNLKSGVIFRYCTTLTEATKRILKNYNECIEIIDLHSTEKGQGTKIMSEFISLSKLILLPLALYAETDELVKYYEKFNFVNHGKQGSSNEFLMLKRVEE